MTLTKNAVALLAPLPLIACVTSGHDQANSKAAIVGPEWVVEDIADRGVIDDARPRSCSETMAVFRAIRAAIDTSPNTPSEEPRYGFETPA